MELRSSLNRLIKLTPQIRGKEFERFLSQVFNKSGLDHHLSYRPQGEEIDGAFWWHDRTILVEAKWVKDPIPASSIYAFRGKVEGKFSGTLGIFISMSGYSEDCISAVQTGKGQNVLLFDHADVSALADGINFDVMLREKLYTAGRTGLIYTPWPQLQDTKRVTREISRSVDGTVKRNLRPLLVICEGPIDRLLLESIINYLQAVKEIKKSKVHYLVAGGYNSISPTIATVTVGSLAHSLAPGIAVLVVVDSDSVDPGVVQARKEQLSVLLDKLPDYSDYALILAAPNIEAWLPEGMDTKQLSLKVLETVDWNAQIIRNPELSNLVNKLKSIVF